MGLADDILEKIHQWIRHREECAGKLEELARGLESTRERCNASETVGNTVSVAGAASLFGAGLATLLTGGAAAPILGFLGAAYTGVGVAVTVGTKITEHFMSSGPMEEAKRIESRSKGTEAEIQQVFQRLKDEIKKKNPSADPDQLDWLFMDRIVRAVARRYSVEYNFDSSDFYHSNSSLVPYMRQGTVRWQQTSVMVGLAGVLLVFAFKLDGKKSKILIAEGTKQVFKAMSSAGLKTVLKGGAMVAGGAVGMAFSLYDAIDSWTKMIKRNHVTEASQSLRDTARDIRRLSQTLRDQLDNIRNKLEEMVRLREEEEKKKLEEMVRLREEEEKKKLEEMASREREKRGTGTPTGAGPLRIGLLKAQSPGYRMSRVPELVSEHHLDVFLTTGVGVQQDTAYQVLQEASPQNFKFYFREESRGLDAVTVHFSELLLNDLLFFDFVTTFQCVVTELQRPGWTQPLLLITVHRDANASATAFLEELGELLDQVSEYYDSVVLGVHFQPPGGGFLQKIVGFLQKIGGFPQQSTTHQFEDLLRTNRLVRYGEGVVFGRDVEISGLTVGVDADSHQYATFTAEPKHREKTRDQEQLECYC